ncbi:survival motor neuron protein, partial [Trichonephila inaurata madagascariensis]
MNWNDRSMVRLYDVVMNFKEKEENNSEDETESLGKKWKVGSNCRARHSNDGYYYEAKIIEITKKKCTVVFWGYNDIQKVSLKHLENSAGKRSRIQQIKKSVNDRIADMSESSEE